MKNYLIVAGISLAIGLAIGCGFGYDQADTKWQLKTDKAVKEALNRANGQYQRTLRQKDELIEAKEALAKAAQDEANRIKDDNRALIDSGNGLRAELRRLFTGLAANNCDTTAVANGEAAACATRVLSELCEVSGDLAAVYASEAVTTRQAGLNCEKEYDLLRKEFDLCIKKAP